MSPVLVTGTGNWEGWEFENVNIIEDENMNEEYVEDEENIGAKSVSYGPRGRQSFLPDLENQLLSETVEDEFIRKFHPGSLVWAKVTGHLDPAWPAKVTRVRERRGLDLHYRVTFYRTNEWAELREIELWPYSQNTEKEFTKLHFLGQRRKKKLFEEAVRDIRQEQLSSATSLPRIPMTILERSRRSSPVSLAVFSNM